VPGAALLAWAGKWIEFENYRRAMIRICGAALSVSLAVWLGIFSFATFGVPSEAMSAQSDRLLIATAVMHVASYRISFLLIISFTILWKVRALRSASD
jgi:hypothetical protein